MDLLSCRRPHAHSHVAGANLSTQGPRVEEQLVQHALQLHACAVPTLSCHAAAPQQHRWCYDRVDVHASPIYSTIAPSDTHLLHM